MLYITKNIRLFGRKVTIQGGSLQFDAQGRIDLKEGQEFLVPVLRLIKLGTDGKEIVEKQKKEEQEPIGPVFEQDSVAQDENPESVGDTSIYTASVIADETSDLAGEAPCDNVSIESMTKTELIALCTEAGLPAKEYTALNKADLITYIKSALK